MITPVPCKSSGSILSDDVAPCKKQCHEHSNINLLSCSSSCEDEGSCSKHSDIYINNDNDTPSVCGDDMSEPHSQCVSDDDDESEVFVNACDIDNAIDVSKDNTVSEQNTQIDDSLPNKEGALNLNKDQGCVGHSRHAFYGKDKSNRRHHKTTFSKGHSLYDRRKILPYDNNSKTSVEKSPKSPERYRLKDFKGKHEIATPDSSTDLQHPHSQHCIPVSPIKTNSPLFHNNFLVKQLNTAFHAPSMAAARPNFPGRDIYSNIQHLLQYPHHYHAYGMHFVNHLHAYSSFRKHHHPYLQG